MKKVALITGGATRLGKAISMALAHNGFEVVINFNNSKKEAADVVNNIRVTTARKALAIKADVSKKNQVSRMVKTAIEEFGQIDLLVNNAAVFIPSTLAKTSENIWDLTIDTNLKGAFFCSQAVAKHMIRRKKGQIINISSLGGIKPFAEHISYSVSKAGLIMLTKCLAKALAPHILVNSIAPGTITFPNDKMVLKNKNEKTLLNHYAAANDITDLVVFFVKCNKQITGRVISVDGGSSII